MRLDGSIAVEMNKVLLDWDDSFFCFYVPSWHSFSRESGPSSVSPDVLIELSIVYYLDSDSILLDDAFANLASTSRSLRGFSQNLIVTHLMYNNRDIPYNEVYGIRYSSWPPQPKGASRSIGSILSILFGGLWFRLLFHSGSAHRMFRDKSSWEFPTAAFQQNLKFFGPSSRFPYTFYAWLVSRSCWGLWR